MLADAGWRAHLGLKHSHGGSPDTLARVLESLSVEELNELCLQTFFTARRSKVLEPGPYGLRCLIVDLNELFTSTQVHCEDCQSRKKKVKNDEGEVVEVTEYFHQAVALVWVGGELTWPVGWEILQPGEGELTAALRLLARLLPKLASSVDLVLGDRLYCCRPFFETVRRHHVHALAIASGVTEMDREMELLMHSEVPRRLSTQEVDVWSMQSEAWKAELGFTLRVAHYRRQFKAPKHKKVKTNLRIVHTADIEVFPDGQGWKVGRTRFRIENGTFNRLTHDHALTHNFHHDTTAILALLIIRSLASVLTLAYQSFAVGRTAKPPRGLLWYKLVIEEDWVRYRDAGLEEARRVKL